MVRFLKSMHRLAYYFADQSEGADAIPSPPVEATSTEAVERSSGISSISESQEEEEVEISLSNWRSTAFTCQLNATERCKVLVIWF